MDSVTILRRSRPPPNLNLKRKGGRNAATDFARHANDADVSQPFSVIECYLLSRPVSGKEKYIGGDRKRTHDIWMETQGLDITEQRSSDQARIIR